MASPTVSNPTKNSLGTNRLGLTTSDCINILMRCQQWAPVCISYSKSPIGMTGTRGWVATTDLQAKWLIRTTFNLDKITLGQKCRINQV